MFILGAAIEPGPATRSVWTLYGLRIQFLLSTNQADGLPWIVHLEVKQPPALLQSIASSKLLRVRPSRMHSQELDAVTYIRDAKTTSRYYHYRRCPLFSSHWRLGSTFVLCYASCTWR